MSHVLTPASTLDSVTVPDPGDARTAASVQVPFQNVLNRNQWLIDHSFMGAALSAGIFQFPLSGGANDDIVNATPGWTYTAGFWLQTDVATAPVLWCDVRLPHRATIESVHLYLNGNGAGGGAHTGLPASLPKLEFQQVDPTAGNSIVATTGVVTDSSANLAAYETNHRIDINGLSIAAVGTLGHRIKVTGESGANAAALKLTLFGISFSWHPT